DPDGHLVPPGGDEAVEAGRAVGRDRALRVVIDVGAVEPDDRPGDGVEAAALVVEVEPDTRRVERAAERRRPRPRAEQLVAELEVLLAQRVDVDRVLRLALALLRRRRSVDLRRRLARLGGRRLRARL